MSIRPRLPRKAIRWSILCPYGSLAPDWPTGIALGAGGLAGAYTGARLQARMPGVLIRRLIGARYLWTGLALLVQPAGALACIFRITG